jgi:uncharacterized delta-60 repeat protein
MLGAMVSRLGFGWNGGRRKQTKVMRAVLETLEDRRLLSTAFTDFGTASPDYAAGVAQLLDGRLVAAGMTNQVGGDSAFALAWYGADGTPQGTTTVPWPLGGSLEEVKAVTVDELGRIVVVGSADDPKDNELDKDWGSEFMVARFTPDGTLDRRFGDMNGLPDDGPGVVTADFTRSDWTDVTDSAYGTALAIDGAGRLLVAGYNQSGNVDAFGLNKDAGFTVVRYNENGGLDHTFGRSDGQGGKEGWEIVPFNLAVDPDGNPANSQDELHAMAVDADGKIVLAGSTSDYDFNFMFGLLRLNEDGSLDTDFDTDGKVTTTTVGLYASVYALAVDADGTILAGGISDPSFALVRYANNGAVLSTTIAPLPDTHAGGIINDLAIGADGTVLAVGYSYSAVDYDSDTAIVRYANGTATYTLESLGESPIGQGDDSAVAASLQTLDGHQFLLVAGSADRRLLDAEGLPVIDEFSGLPITSSDFALTRMDLGPITGGGGGSISVTLDGTATGVEGSALTFTANAVVESGGGSQVVFIQNQHRGEYGAGGGGGGEIGELTYAWAVNGAPAASGPANTFTFTPPDDGGYIVSVTVSGGGLSASADQAVAVANVAPTVSLTGPSNAVRQQPVTFSGSFTDPGTLDPHTLSWQVSDAGGVLLSGSGGTFNFVPDVAGALTVTFTVSDDDTSSSISQTLVVSEAAIVDGVLIVGGTSGADDIDITPAGGGMVRVLIGGVSVGVFGPVGRVIVHGGAGDDDIKARAGLARPVEVFGGDGNDLLRTFKGGDLLVGGAGDDTLTGHDGADILLGGDGDDLLVGGPGRDLLIGGRGADRLVGRADDDILVAGDTAYDDVLIAENHQALDAILAEWNSDCGYDVRVKNLWDGSGSATRLNGSAFLAADVTVFDDGAEDILTGNQGMDWFLCNKDSGVIDRITDLSAREFADDLDLIQQAEPA